MMQFGTLNIPESTEISKSAQYISPKWEDVSNYFQIQMYLTAPDGITPLEKPTKNRKI